MNLQEMLINETMPNAPSWFPYAGVIRFRF